MPPPREIIEASVAIALREDIGGGDVSAALIDPSARCEAQLIARQTAVLCGSAWFESALQSLDKTCQITWRRQDGDLLAADEIVCEIAANTRAMLSAERSAINFLQTLSATATAARRYAAAVEGFGAQIIDTRKTLPGMRLAQKYAVAVGGAGNHRIGLYDCILIKENHIAAAASIAEAVRRAKAAIKSAASKITWQIEVESIAQLREALAAGATRILLDNFDLDALRESVAIAKKHANGRAKLEASGNITLQNIRAIAATGIDFISVGALTKNIEAVDFSLLFTAK